MHAKATLYLHSKTTEHLIQAHSITQTFRIKVVQPIRRRDTVERFPVMYATDSDELFGGLSNLATLLQLVGETPRFVLVAIGYENPLAADLLRMRDLFTHAVRARFQAVIDQLAASPLAPDLDDLGVVTRTTDARDFLRFIRAELMPFICAQYPVLPDETAYFGYSAGGTFGLHTLFTEPETFKRYILASPGTSYNGQHFGLEMARAFLQSGRSANAKVFMSVGELEEFYGKFDLTSGFYLLAKFLKNAAIPGLDLQVRVFPGETHVTAWTLALTHGLKQLLGPADQTPWWPEFDAGS